MKQIHRITTLLLLSCILSLVACSKQQEETTTTSSIQKEAGTPTASINPTTIPEEKAIVAPTIAPEEIVIVTPTIAPEEDVIAAPTIAPTPIVYPEGEGSTSTESGILSVENDIKPLMIAIDAGHQSKANNDKEPIGPGATTMKAKVSSGTLGVATEVPEYKLNLVIALKVKEELLDRGYEVYMIRESNDVNLSNRERAEMANESGADLFLRIHADGSENSSVSGTSTLYPSKDNPYVSNLSKDSHALSEAIVAAMCERTGAKNRGAIARDDMSGINWCSIPVSIIEMGYMSNREEDKLMQNEEYQDKIAQGICDGIDDYYE
ncbi:MAG: cell wall hydrolase/autolysin [Herbinix sp.]|jgi:N-acetylmuramoyl-L-alanine amidase|nr:cell wall hydrolase/autolysin [Herbinix sp.]